MIPSQLYRLPYRVLQKLIVFGGARTLVAPVDCLAAAPTQPSSVQHQLVRLNEKNLARHIARGEAPYCESLALRINEPRLHCFGAIENEKLVAFIWVHEGSAEAEMNYGCHLGTATSIGLANDSAFVFHVYTAPEARGQGWMGAVLRHAAQVLGTEHGIESFVTTTEVINRAALAGFTKIGFEERGVYWRYGLGSLVRGWYPKPIFPILSYG